MIYLFLKQILRQLAFSYGACATCAKTPERMKKFKVTSDAIKQST